MSLHRASLLLVLTACIPPSVAVTPTKGAPPVPSKAKDCEIEFFEIDTLQRPYDVLGEVRATPSSLSFTAQKPATMDAMRQQACLLGADAVIGVHALVGSGYSPYTKVGTAVRYRR